ncbi:MAG: YbaB/EbfC family nucleoid-associated protein [Pseudomonadota bacterium]
MDPVRAQSALDDVEVEGESGAGMVKAVASAKGALKRLTIDPSLFNPDDKEVVEDLIVAAVKDAQEKAQTAAQEEMAKVTEGMALPPGMKMPF